VKRVPNVFPTCGPDRARPRPHLGPAAIAFTKAGPRRDHPRAARRRGAKVKGGGSLYGLSSKRSCLGESIPGLWSAAPHLECFRTKVAISTARLPACR
jgi:hypothetical protein